MKGSAIAGGSGSGTGGGAWFRAFGFMTFSGQIGVDLIVFGLLSATGPVTVHDAGLSASYAHIYGTATVVLYAQNGEREIVAHIISVVD